MTAKCKQCMEEFMNRPPCESRERCRTEQDKLEELEDTRRETT